jgi:hypothetical protein
VIPLNLFVGDQCIASVEWPAIPRVGEVIDITEHVSREPDWSKGGYGFTQTSKETSYRVMAVRYQFSIYVNEDYMGGKEIMPVGIRVEIEGF